MGRLTVNHSGGLDHESVTVNHTTSLEHEGVARVNASRPTWSTTRGTDSPLAVSGAVLVVCLLAPLILAGNAALLAAVCRFKRLRTPSNLLVASLAGSDFGTGLLLPAGLYLELTRFTPRPLAVCLLPFCVAIALGSASLCAMAAIAADRFTSLAQPLRYNNLITHASIERYIMFIWIYALVIGFSPLYYLDKFSWTYQVHECTFLCISKQAQILLLSSVYAPCTIVLLACYGYIYVVARYHARAIYSVEVSLRQTEIPAVVTTHSRYGQTLALTIGLFLVLWLPFVSCMIMGVIHEAPRILAQDWVASILVIPVFTSSALNPWMYGYHNTELRLGMRRIICDILSKLGRRGNCRDAYSETNSCASNARLCAVSPNRTLLVPRPDTLECSTFGSAARETAVHHDANRYSSNTLQVENNRLNTRDTMVYLEVNRGI